MKYYVWVDENDRPVSKAWPYEDEIERMVAGTRPPAGAVALRAGTKEQLKFRYGLADDDFVEG